MSQKQKARSDASLWPKVSIEIRDIRLKMGLNQTEFAERVSISPSEVSVYERGMRIPSVQTLALMSHALGIKLDDLIKVKPVKTGDSK